MKIKLIFPKGQSHNFWDLKFSAKISEKKYSGISLSLPTIASLTPRDIDIEILDENVEPINFDDKADLVGISYFTTFANRAYEIADEFRKRGVKVVLGGIHASALFEEALLHADAVVIGEAENIWQKVIEDFKNKKLRKIYRSSERTNLANSPIPRWDLVNPENYNFYSVQATRGCPFNCEFCSVKSFLGDVCRFKPIDNVIDEIDYIHSLVPKKGIVFADDNILSNKQYTIALIKAISAIDIESWWCQSSINIAQHEDILELMAASGCTQIFIGFESLSQESLNIMNKGTLNKVNDYLSAVDKIHSHGISVFGSFILGNDGDKKDIFKTTVDFISEANIAFALIGLLVPFPGTRLFLRLTKENRLLTEDWDRYNGETVTFVPRHFSIKTLQEGHKWVLKQLYSYDALSRRLNNLWKRGVLVKKSGMMDKYFSLAKIGLAIRGVMGSINKFDRAYFLLRNIYNPYNPRFFSILSAVDFHDVVMEYLNTEI